jgi:uncharacterized OB-fold protein
MNSGNGSDWSPENVPYWEAAKAGQLLVRRCTACGEAHYYPRAICPYCGSARTEWLTASGRGVIYSFTLMRRAAPPFVLAYVTLEEGITMLTNVVDCDPSRLSIGQPVVAVFRPTDDGRQVPMFVPARSPPPGR